MSSATATEEASASVSNANKRADSKSRLANTSSANPLKLKIPPAYTPDPWVCDHKRKKNEFNPINCVAATKQRKLVEVKKKLKPFLTGVLRASPTKDSNNKCDWRCNHARNRCVKNIDYSMLNNSKKTPNVSIRMPGRRNESWSEVKSVNLSMAKAKKVVVTRSAKIDKASKPKQRPLSLKSVNKSKPKNVFNKAKLNFRKKLTSIKNKCMSLKSPQKPVIKIALAKKGKIMLRKKTSQTAPLLDEEYNTLDSIMSEGLD
jgi:hypothetical protein